MIKIVGLNMFLWKNVTLGGSEMKTEDRVALTKEIDSKIDEFFAELCAKYGIVILNLNELYWDYEEYMKYE